MNDAAQLLFLATVGVFLLWLGYTLFIGRIGNLNASPRKMGKDAPEGIPGAPRTCPVCSILLPNGERVRSSAFPAMGGSDRLMHISGCPYCMGEKDQRNRTCPVCRKSLAKQEYLIARIFDKPGRSHVHVLGCTRCRGPRSGR
jgi:hypothetical protein